MLDSLHLRLIVSYIVVIAICLALIAGAMTLLLLRTDSLNRQVVRDQLVVSLATVRRLVQPDLRNNMPPDQVMADLKTRFDTQTTRVLLIGPNRRVLSDSAGQLEGRDVNELTVGQTTRLPDNIVSGNLNVGERLPWVFVTQTAPIARVTIAVAQPPQPSRPGILTEIISRLSLAGCIGGVIALLLAVLIAQSVSRPLNRLAQAANAIANGDYDQAVPVQGPSEVKELAENFNSMVRQVQISQQSQRDFMANVSHDLKTPLTSIQGFAQAISEGAAGDRESIQRSARVIQDEAERMTRMVTELLDIARIESGQIVMRREAIQLNAIARDCTAKLVLRAQQAGIDLRIRAADDLPVIMGDGDRLAQVITNLLDNAIKHTPSGGHITVDLRSLSGSSIVRRGKVWPAGVELTVADTGSGIPPEDLSRIFERFYQVDKSRPRGGGLGLGLAIAKQIVEAHNGTIQVESAVGRGSRFIVTLPFDPGGDATQPLRRR